MKPSSFILALVLCTLASTVEAACPEKLLSRWENIGRKSVSEERLRIWVKGVTRDSLVASLALTQWMSWKSSLHPGSLQSRAAFDLRWVFQQHDDFGNGETTALEDILNAFEPLGDPDGYPRVGGLLGLVAEAERVHRSIQGRFAQNWLKDTAGPKTSGRHHLVRNLLLPIAYRYQNRVPHSANCSAPPDFSEVAHSQFVRHYASDIAFGFGSMSEFQDEYNRFHHHIEGTRPHGSKTDEQVQVTLVWKKLAEILRSRERNAVQVSPFRTSRRQTELRDQRIQGWVSEIFEAMEQEQGNPPLSVFLLWTEQEGRAILYPELQKRLDEIGVVPLMEAINELRIQKNRPAIEIGGDVGGVTPREAWCREWVIQIATAYLDPYEAGQVEAFPLHNTHYLVKYSHLEVRDIFKLAKARRAALAAR